MSEDSRDVVGTMHKSAIEVLYSKGYIPALAGFESTPLVTLASLEAAEVSNERLAEYASLIATLREQIERLKADRTAAGEDVYNLALQVAALTEQVGELKGAISSVIHDLVAVQTDPRTPSSARVKEAVIRSLEAVIASGEGQ